MTFPFYKYHGTGNDFVIIDNRTLLFPKNDTKLISLFCDRHLGVGGDGLILLENDNTEDFRMVYYNADGHPGSMCGNGGRCIVSFARYLGIIDDKTSFVATDGLHMAVINRGSITLKMQDVSQIRNKPNALYLNTGSPHHVQEIPNLGAYNVKEEGARLRYGIYGEKGCNINFVEQLNQNTFFVRTYERGVEDETLSCGTGVTAVALAMHRLGKTSNNDVIIKTKGGNLKVTFEKGKEGYEKIFLEGPAKQVFKGTLIC